jgi:hypothetical protein
MSGSRQINPPWNFAPPYRHKKMTPALEDAEAISECMLPGRSQHAGLNPQLKHRSYRSSLRSIALTILSKTVCWSDQPTTYQVIWNGFSTGRIFIQPASRAGRD